MLLGRIWKGFFPVSQCQYGLDYTLDAMNDCWTIINNITNQPNSPDAAQIQILPGNNTILTNPASFEI